MIHDAPTSQMRNAAGEGTSVKIKQFLPSIRQGEESGSDADPANDSDDEPLIPLSQESRSSSPGHICLGISLFQGSGSASSSTSKRKQPRITSKATSNRSSGAGSASGKPPVEAKSAANGRAKTQGASPAQQGHSPVQE